MTLDIVTWMWGDKYGPEDVVRLESRIRKNLRLPCQFHLFTDNHHWALPPSICVWPISDPELIGKGCFCRLRMFDPDWQRQHKMFGTIVSIDLDVVVVRELDPLFETKEPFKILTGANASNPNPYNASIMLLKAGQHPGVWREFSLEKAMRTQYHEFPDDQGWIWHMLPDVKGWPVGKASGIYAFQKPGWPKGSALPDAARLVVFFGWRKPQMFSELPWIKEHWTAAA